ncbi:MAG TPA: ribosome silencing factor [Pyrinomonadaceae bacterium]|nr:ribosome silencing factor [Pyrinomonadaceae bacterium]
MKENSPTTGTKKRAAKKRAAEGAEGEAEVAAAEGGGGAEPRGGLDERMVTALEAASDKKALDPVALDLRAIASFTDFFLITSATNVRQVQAIADEIVERLKKMGTRPARVEGYASAEWVLVDYGDFVVHVFEEKARRFYDLERLWRDAERVALPPEITGGDAAAGGGASSLREQS